MEVEAELVRTRHGRGGKGRERQDKERESREGQMKTRQGRICWVN